MNFGENKFCILTYTLKIRKEWYAQEMWEYPINLALAFSTCSSEVIIFHFLKLTIGLSHDSHGIITSLIHCHVVFPNTLQGNENVPP